MFLYSALAAGFAFVAVPPLVHLINMLRHRRRRWAAMDFLLSAYRKQKKWIRLRQLLLLLSRIAVAALLVAALAGWTGGSRIAAIIGGATTHHVVVLDDSYSMGQNLSRRVVGDQQNRATPYDRALGMLASLSRELASADGVQQLTVIRSSRATLARSAADAASADAAADMVVTTIAAGDTVSELDRLMSTIPSSLAAPIDSAVDVVAGLIDGVEADQTRLYLLTDLQASRFENPERLNQALAKLDSSVVTRIVDCGDRRDPTPPSNLSITSLAPQPDVWVAGVPVVASIGIRNHAATTARNVAVKIRVLKYSDETLVRVDEPDSSTAEALPPVVIESIPPGGVATTTFQVFVPQVGTHVIEATLPADALAIDNRRVATLPLSADQKVLIVDGDVERTGAYFLSAVLDPGSQVRIGAVPEIQSPEFLRGVDPSDLQPYRAIYLCNVPSIGTEAARALSSYVRGGGGLAIFMGENTDRDSYNANLAVGPTRLLPGTIGRSVELASADNAERQSTTSDIRLGDARSPITDPLRAMGDSALSLVTVLQSWPMEIDSTEALPVKVLLKRRDGLPLVTEQSIGEGRVVTATTGLGGGWTNWPGDPTFVVFVLQTNASLFSVLSPETSRPVTGGYTAPAGAKFFPPGQSPPRSSIDLTGSNASSTSASNSSASATPPSNSSASATPQTATLTIDPAEQFIDGVEDFAAWLKPGLGEMVTTDAAGREIAQPVASVLDIDVDTEGDLRRAGRPAVVAGLLPTRVSIVQPDAFGGDTSDAGSSRWTLVLLGVLAVFLFIEQLLASWASFHRNPSASSSAPVTGFASS